MFRKAVVAVHEKLLFTNVAPDGLTLLVMETPASWSGSIAMTGKFVDAPTGKTILPGSVSSGALFAAFTVVTALARLLAVFVSVSSV